MNIYETDKLLGEYLLFHYGSAAEIAPPAEAEGALEYPARCVSECLDLDVLPPGARALDLGCAVGRSTFELARHCKEVVGIDFSRRFIESAETLRTQGELPFARTDEGDLTAQLVARPPSGVESSRVKFEVGDAMALRPDLGSFDVVLAANLIDRLSEPQELLARLPELVRPGGQLILTSPYTWLEEFTPRAHWIGGFVRDNLRVRTLAGLRLTLEEDFTLVAVKELPFLIREHARKFQWSVAQGSVWRRVATE